MFFIHILYKFIMNPPPYNPYPNATAPPPPEMNKNQKVEKLIRDYEIDNLFSERLDILSNFEIVLIVDDSGSMNTPIANSKMQQDGKN